MWVDRSYKTVGCFYIGNEMETVRDFFALLEGTPVIASQSPLKMVLSAVSTDREEDLLSLDCTMTEILQNIRTVMKETFRQLNFKPI